MPRRHQQGINPFLLSSLVHLSQKGKLWECKIKCLAMRITNLKRLEKRVPTSVKTLPFSLFTEWSP